MMIDPIADLLTRIRNASRALLAEVQVPHSRMKESVVRLLKQEGYITDWAVEGAAAKRLKLKLKYQGRKGVIENLRRVSTPGSRRYVRATEMPRVLGGMGTVIVSTSRGVMTGAEARKQNLGGEVICYVW
ncbi:MAG: 30S ribosomal protein S8 [Verrucomicrobia bacterium]|nr:30S ribosomal protein S8 [Verrucomicrobiota bacterium]